MADDGLGWLSMFNSPWATGAGTAASLGGDIFSLIQNLQRQNAIRNVYQILSNPNAFAAYAGKLMPQYSPQAINLFNQGVGANWAAMTGGAPGGAAGQYLSDAWAKLISSNWANALGGAQGALGQAGQTASGLPQYGMGQLGGILNALKVLRGIRGPDGGSSPGLATGFPMPGGPGFAGGSEAFRDYSAPQGPALSSIPGTIPGI